jgi:catechol 2,3-dioxygenase-like lactoylglutathione lyase family enzyme
MSLGLALWATDVGALSAFLVEIGGLTEVARHPGYAALKTGEGDVFVYADESYAGHPWFDAVSKEGSARGIGTDIRLRVDDVVALHTRAVAAGGVSVAAPYEDDGKRVCQVMGPDGYLFTLWQPSAAS